MLAGAVLNMLAAALGSAAHASQPTDTGLAAKDLQQPAPLAEATSGAHTDFRASADVQPAAAADQEARFADVSLLALESPLPGYGSSAHLRHHWQEEVGAPILAACVEIGLEALHLGRLAVVANSGYEQGSLEALKQLSASHRGFATGAGRTQAKFCLRCAEGQCSCVLRLT